jgi:hypothetical protein
MEGRLKPHGTYFSYVFTETDFKVLYAVKGWHISCRSNIAA